MMNTNQILTITILVFLLISCSSTNFLNQGSVEPSEFHTKIDFTTMKSIILIPCEVDGKIKNFIFDTGAQVTSVQRDSIFGDTIEVRGATNRVVKNGSEIIESLKINEVNFVKTFATNDPFPYLTQKIPNFGGILGRSVMNKANWLINYPAKTIEISNKDLSDDSYFNIELDKKHETPYTDININGKTYRAIIDLGSSSTFNVPEETELAKELIELYTFEKNTRERYTVGGNDTITELIGHIPKLSVNGNEFQNVYTNINKSSQIRLGIQFFKDFAIFIDNENHKYRLRRIQ